MSAQPSHLTYPVQRATVTDPPEEYARLQKEAPVCPITLATGFPALFVTAYDDVKTVLSDPRFSRDALFEPGAPRAQLAEPDQDSIISIDPPRHSRLRRLINREFSRRRVEGMRPEIERHVSELLDEMETKGPPGDLNDMLGRPLALRVICNLLGVPYADHMKFGRWCDHFMSYAKYPLAEVGRANSEMRAYLADLIETKRQDPGEDLLSALVQARDSEGALTENELVSLGVILLLAGHDTTVTALGGGVVTLLRNPETLAELRGDPALIPRAIEELLRLNEPGDGSFLRIATEDIELRGGQVAAGSAVVASISTANRDPSVFTDPERLDIHRESNPHIAFGFGTHFCVGSSLARIELECALAALLPRFPGLRLAVPFEDLRWRSYAHLGGIEELPVRW